ncbi:MAG: DUF1778 domain-containing protein [Bryobacteraceae bacterium]|jgi:uncharacterized protein (DUF1778 family)
MAATIPTAPAAPSAGKAERLEARITPAQKEILQHAAELEGRSLTDFVVSSAQAAARRIIHEHEILLLSAKDREVFVNALLNSPAPNDKLRRAARRYKQKQG